MIAEGMEKSRNAVNVSYLRHCSFAIKYDVQALVGIETDEDAGVQMPAIIQLKRQLNNFGESLRAMIVIEKAKYFFMILMDRLIPKTLSLALIC